VGREDLSVQASLSRQGERKKINAWVEKRTREHIKDPFPPGALDGFTRLVVANAIYFKGQWMIPFEVSLTKDRPFTLSGGKKVQVPTMHADSLEVARYAAFNGDGTFFTTPSAIPPRTKDTAKFYPGAQGFQMLELPYKGGELSMVVIVPRSTDRLQGLEKRLNADNLRSWVGKFQQRAVHVDLPKFKLEASFDLKQTMQALGMKRAFRNPSEKQGAQFDGMSDVKVSREQQLYISKVLHKAFVETSEKGTVAAAATAGESSEGADEPAVPFTPEFKADRPFVFLIRDQKTGAILFLGRVLNPKTGG
jgi:serine protease inhibitor